MTMRSSIRLHLVLMLATATVASASEASKPLQPAGHSSEKIVNGTTSVGFPSVVALVDDDDEQFCSGTLIGCDTVLTAAHCVCASTGVSCQEGGPDLAAASSFEVYTQHSGFFSVSSIAVPENYVFGGAGDVAVLKLSTTVNGISPTPINTGQSPGTGVGGTIVGFGLTDGNADDSGMKRAGQVVSASCASVPDAGHVCWDFTAPLGAAGDDSNTCSGDSGGPLFMNLGDGTVVAGVASGGAQADCQPEDASFATDVFVERAWIEAEAGADLSNRICGGLEQAGTSGAIIHFAEDSLDESNDEDRWNLQLSSDVKYLRVMLNAEEGSDNDFDVYMRSVAVPTTTAFDCRSIRNGVYEACERVNLIPPGALWHFLVRRFSGSGNYQLMVIPYERAPGSVLYAVGTGSSSTLYEIFDNTAIPRSTPIGEAGVPLLDVAIDPTTDRIYGVNDSSLYELSVQTGVASLIGSTGGPVIDALEFDDRGQAYGWGPSGDLYRVDKATGAATAIGPTGFTSGGGLAIDSDGALYGITNFDFFEGYRLIRIDSDTGAGTLVGRIGPIEDGIAFDDVFSLEIDLNGTMYLGRGREGSTLAEVYLINKGSGVTTFIGEIRNHLNGMTGLAFVDPPEAPIFADGFESGDVSAWSGSR